jgi:hypothetical protein
MHRPGIWSASALFVIGLAYIIVVATAMISGGGYTNPIGDPLGDQGAAYLVDPFERLADHVVANPDLQHLEELRALR